MSPTDNCSVAIVSLSSSSYRKIAGDVCRGGNESQFAPRIANCSSGESTSLCTSSPFAWIHSVNMHSVSTHQVNGYPFSEILCAKVSIGSGSILICCNSSVVVLDGKILTSVQKGSSLMPG